MPFIRHLRDKRGYETTYVMHAYRPQQGPQRTRVLYLFRTPAHLKLWRRALDEEIREALEHTHPDVSFDWSALARESAVTEAPRGRNPRGSDRGSDRGGDRGADRGGSTPPARAAKRDDSLLGRRLGTEEAARLRGRYAELVDRIARRARTPEDRDRLMARLVRLNPNDWTDASTLAATVAAAETEWEAIRTELPSRRRGRRGGRRPDGSDGPNGPEEGDASDGAERGDGAVAPGDASPDRVARDPQSSGIISESHDVEGAGHDQVAGAERDSGGPGDRTGGGPGTDEPGDAVPRHD